MVTKLNDPRRKNFIGLSDAEIAAKVGTSPKMVWKVRTRAERKIRLALEREAEAKGVSVREFLFGEEV